MLTGANLPIVGEPDDDERYEEEVDPATLAPLCGEEEFAAEVSQMVAEEAPRLFAVVQEYGTRVDGRIAAWGMAFPDKAEVLSVNARSRMILRSPELALRWYHRRPDITASLVWVPARSNPDTEPPAAAVLASGGHPDA